MIKLFHGDSFELIKSIDSKSIKLVMTDVPYPDMQVHDVKNHIINSEDWADWFDPLAKEIYRVLTDDGSFVTTINSKDKEHFQFYSEFICYMCDGLNFKYVYPWFWVKTMLWRGRMIYPRNGVDYIAHFSKKIRSDIYNMCAIKDWSVYNPNTRIPSNLIYGSSRSDKLFNEIQKSTGIKHPGRLPEIIPDMFIRLLTNTNDIVLDLFNGSGTITAKAEELGRDSIGFECNDRFIDLATTIYTVKNMPCEVLR